MRRRWLLPNLHGPPPRNESRPKTAHTWIHAQGEGLYAGPHLIGGISATWLVSTLVRFGVATAIRAAVAAGILSDANTVPAVSPISRLSRPLAGVAHLVSVIAVRTVHAAAPAYFTASRSYSARSFSSLSLSA